MRNLAALRKDFGLLAYQPHAKQDKFHRSTAKRRGCFSGNRFGKSHMGCAENASWMLGHRAFYPKGDLARTSGIPQKPNKGLVLTNDWDLVNDIWTDQRGESPGKIWSAIPKDFVKSYKRNNQGIVYKLEFQNGSLLQFDTAQSWKSNPLGSESADWDFIHVDEPVPEGMWTAVSRGLVDRGGSAWFTLTPVRERWIVDLFFPKTFSVKKLPAEYSSGNRWVIRGSIYDNPHISREGIEEFLASLTPEERECRANGIPLELTGLVYPEFDWDRHVLTKLPLGWTTWHRPPASWPLYIRVDVHPKRPQAVLCLTVSPHGQKFVFAEFFRKALIGEVCEYIKTIVQGRHLADIKVDPLAWIPNPVTGETIADDFFRHGILVEKASKALTQGILKVKEELVKPDNLYFVPGLEETFSELQRYCWDPENERPVDENDHMMENLYRLLIDDPIFIDCSPSASSPVADMVIDRPTLSLADVSINP